MKKRSNVECWTLTVMHSTLTALPMKLKLICTSAEPTLRQLAKNQAKHLSNHITMS